MAPLPRRWGDRPLWFYAHGMAGDTAILREAWRHETELVAAGAGEWAAEVGLDEQAAGEWIGRARAAVAAVIEEEEHQAMLGRGRDEIRAALAEVEAERRYANQSRGPTGERFVGVL